MTNELPDDMQANAVESASNGFGQALEALALFLFVLALQAGRAILLILPPLIRLACAALPFYSAGTLYVTTRQAYGADVPASMLALGIAAYIPAAIFTLSRTWGALLLAGLIELGLRAALPHAPPIVLALLPVVIIAGITFQTLRDPEQTDPPHPNERTIEDEQITR